MPAVKYSPGDTVYVVEDEDQEVVECVVLCVEHVGVHPFYTVRGTGVDASVREHAYRADQVFSSAAIAVRSVAKSLRRQAKALTDRARSLEASIKDPKP